MYNHILVAVAFDEGQEPERALLAAAALASAAARVTVLHVKEEVPSYAIAYMPEKYDIGLREAIREQLLTMAEPFENGHAVLLDGHSGRTILDWANENSVDCIILNSHKPNIVDYFLGGTANVVMRRAQCSVHVIR